jgi:hypothetical protein
MRGCKSRFVAKIPKRNCDVSILLKDTLSHIALSSFPFGIGISRFFIIIGLALLLSLVLDMFVTFSAYNSNFSSPSSTSTFPPHHSSPALQSLHPNPSTSIYFRLTIQFHKNNRQRANLPNVHSKHVRSPGCRYKGYQRQQPSTRW